MSKALITESALTAIANAIRDKLDSADTYKPSEMAAAIESIDSGYPEPTGTVAITQNGTANVKDYASASVSVPNSYAAGDEGKVVSNGALVSQTAHATVTENGTIDTTLNNSVVVDVSGNAVYAFAYVVYKQGNTVTATDGTTTLTSDTSGAYVFAITDAGTWTFVDAIAGISISYTFAVYGERKPLYVIDHLPYSTTVLGEAIGDNYVSGASTWDDFDVTGTPADARKNQSYGVSVVNLPLTAKAEFTMPTGDFTTYAVMKNYTNGGNNYIFGIPYSMSNGNGVGFTSTGGKINASNFGGNYSTNIDSMLWHVYAISVDTSTKKVRMFLDGVFQKEWSYNNIGNVYVTGEGSNNSGRQSNADVAYVGVSDGCESDATVISNMGILMNMFDDLGRWNA